ncbi:MAG: histidine kinase [Actinomycetota bacterium]
MTRPTRFARPSATTLPRRGLAVVSVALAALAMLTDAPGSGLEPVLHAVAVVAVVGWSLGVSYPPWLLALLVGGAVAGLGWAGGTPDGVVFQAVLAAGIVGYAEPRLPHSGGLALGLSVTPWLGTWFPGDTDWTGWNWFAGALMLWVAGVLVGRLVATVDALRATQAELVEAELRAGRRDMARDVHDIVGHSLTTVLVHLEAAQQALDIDRDLAADSLQQAATAGRAGMHELRSSVDALRHTDARNSLPDGRDLRRLLEDRVDVRASVTGPVDDVDGSCGVVIYRVAQEALTNAAKHGSAGPIEVEVVVDETAVALRVLNHVAAARRPGRPQVRAAGLGLTGMRDRVHQVGGRVSSGPTDDGRWLLDASVPRR